MSNEKANDIEDLPDYIEDLADGIFEKYRTYFDILVQFNNKMNLISQSTIPQAGRKHFADCHIGVKAFDAEIPNGETVHDFGSGNGFPGMIFSIMRPDTKVVLVERDRRKCEFLKHVAHLLDLKNVTVHVGGARDLGESNVKYAISRAMSPLPKLLLEVRTVMASGHSMYLFKSEYWTGEFSQTPPQLFEFWDVNPKAEYQLAKLDAKKFIIECKRLDAR